jgi:NAD(P)-dependent dehydrogenase (short-subunit alcohol dehydrogenase family)
MTLKDKTVYVSGASLRIGRSLALSIARAGGNLLIHYNHSFEQAESLKAEIELLGQKAQIFQADFSDPDSTRKHAQAVFSNHHVYGLINNASLFADLSWSNTNLESWQDHLAVNLTAPFLLSQAFARSISKGSQGRIINLLDWRAFRPGSDHFPYTISKAGLIALTKSLAVSLAPQVTVNGIALGAVLPPSDGGSSDNVISRLPHPRWAEIEEIEETMLFLLTGPTYITGEVIHVDGGRHLV